MYRPRCVRFNAWSYNFTAASLSKVARYIATTILQSWLEEYLHCHTGY